MATITETVKSQSFRKGYMEVKAKDQFNVKVEIMRFLKITDTRSFRSRMLGAVSPTIDEAKGIEKIFKKYRVNDPWGEK